MAVKLKRYGNTTDRDKNPMDRQDTTQEQRETTVDGYTFHWGINQTRNFADDGVGAAHAAFSSAGHDTVVEDTAPSGDSRS